MVSSTGHAQMGHNENENAACYSGLDPESRSSFRRRLKKGLDTGLRRYETMDFPIKAREAYRDSLKRPTGLRKERNR